MRACTFGLALAVAALATGAAAQSPVGLWRTPPTSLGATADVRVAPCAGGGGTLCGQIVAVYDAPPDVPDVTGDVIMRDMTFDGRRWSGGTVTAPDDGRTYRGRMTLESADRLRLEGCVLGGLICRGQTWTRLD